MIPLYKNHEIEFELFHKHSNHARPHLHKAMEFAWVTKGTLEIGIEQELYHMETGDFAIVFPDLIHHYQVFDSGSTAWYLLADPVLCGSFQQTLQQFVPEHPVIHSHVLHPDIKYAIHSLAFSQKSEHLDTLQRAFLEIIAARSLPLLNLKERSAHDRQDLIYQTVLYIAAHFRESVTLTGMAHDLGVSPYVLSRVFSSAFHCNFNQYLNETRLDYVTSLLRYTDQTITEACENAGFDSQRTFNRVFARHYHMTPREYRREYRNSHTPARS
ncbi:MAG: AraC family transcriptional regulator [Lachnospiraceae bacterium]|nr:AraC family transcriptional regulator [Lachnospiraceae bacterium]